MQRVRFHNTGPDQIPGLIVMSISDKIEGVDLDPKREQILVFINATTLTVTFTDESLEGLALQGVDRGVNATLGAADGAAYDASRGTFTIPAQSSMVLVEGAELVPTALTPSEEPAQVSLNTQLYLPTVMNSGNQSQY